MLRKVTYPTTRLSRRLRKAYLRKIWRTSWSAQVWRDAREGYFLKRFAGEP